MKKLVKIYGLNCLQCKIQLLDDLNAAEGIEAEIDFDKEIVSITTSKPMSDKEILAIIASCGYDGVIL